MNILADRGMDRYPRAMRAVVLNPEDRTIEEFGFSGAIQELYNALGCRVFTSIQIAQHIGYCDDMGLYRTPGHDGMLPVVLLEGFHQPIVGNIVLLGLPSPDDQDGRETACTLTLQEISAFTTFARLQLRV